MKFPRGRYRALHRREISVESERLNRAYRARVCIWASHTAAPFETPSAADVAPTTGSTNDTATSAPNGKGVDTRSCVHTFVSTFR